MKEWIVLQGWPLYLMLGMTGLGLLGSILSRIFYGRLAREAQLCGTSDYPMLHYIRQKYSSYYKTVLPARTPTLPAKATTSRPA